MVRETKTLKMEEHGDIHVRLLLHRPDFAVSGRNTLTVGGVSTVMVDSILHVVAADERNTGKGVGK